MAENCRICNTLLTKFLSLGEMPIANAFLSKCEIDEEEYTYELAAGFCEDCKMVQLLEVPPQEKYLVPQEDEGNRYLYFASTSEHMVEHFSTFADEVTERFLSDDPRIVEIGSNDGIFLKNFSDDVDVLGIEPANNVAEVARERGVESINEFFSTDVAERIVEEHGDVDVVFGANTILNIPDLHDLMDGIDTMIRKDGVFVMEDPHMLEILKKTAFDQFYDEHLYYFSVASITNLVRMYDMEIFDVKKQPTHGGSLRIFIQRSNGPYQVSDRVRAVRSEEERAGISDAETYRAFSDRVQEIRDELLAFINAAVDDGKRVVGYGASSKGNIVLNYCSLGADVLEYIVDNTPAKQGTYTPGMHVPVVAPELFREDYPDYALLLAWNHAEEIMEKEAEFIEAGGEFVRYIPELEVL